MDKSQSEIKVSIVVAVYNAEIFLHTCLDSLLGQTYKNIEILCINDCSTDRSLQVINDYAARDSRVVVINHEENQRGGGAYDSGIINATGEYVCIVDNDDWLREDAIETLIVASENGKYDIVGSAHVSVFRDRTERITKALEISSDRNYILSKALQNGFAMIGNLIRREIFIKNDLYYPRKFIYADIPILYCVLFYAKSIKGIDVPLYYYSHIPTSITARPSIQKVKDRITATDLYIENLRQRGFYTDEFKELIDYKYLTYSAYTMVMLSKLNWKEARPLFQTLKERIAQFLPNAFLKQASFKNRMIIKFPTLSYLLGFLYVRIYKGRR